MRKLSLRLATEVNTHMLDLLHTSHGARWKAYDVQMMKGKL